MTTTVVRYINAASSPGGNGTTQESSGANRAYSSFNEWQTAEAKDLVTADENHKVYVLSGVYDETFTISSSWITSSSCQIFIGALSGHECRKLDFSEGARIITGTNVNFTRAFQLTNSVDWLTIYGIGVWWTGSRGEFAHAFDIFNNNINNRKLINCIAKSNGGNAFNQSADSSVYYINCIAIDSVFGFISVNYDNPHYYFCAAINNTTGFNRSGTIGSRARAIGCVAFGNGTGFTGTHWESVHSSSNATDDGSSVGQRVVSNSLTSSDIQVVDGEIIIPSGSALIGAGPTRPEIILYDFNNNLRKYPFTCGPIEVNEISDFEIFAFDNYDRVANNLITTSFDGWTELNSDSNAWLRITNEQYARSWYSNATYRWNVPAPSENYRVENYVDLKSIPISTRVGVIARMPIDSVDGYCFYWNKTNNFVSQYILGRINSSFGVDSIISTSQSGIYNLDDFIGQIYRFAIEVNGQNIKCFSNETLIFDIEDSSITTPGYAGIYMRNHTSSTQTSGIHAVEFFAIPLEGGPPPEPPERKRPMLFLQK